MIIPHQEALEVFKLSHEKDRLSHAYIISGPKFVGKREFLESVLKIIFNDQDFSLKTVKPNLNLHQIDLGAESISVEAVRDFVHILTLGGIGSGYKVGVIYNANLMSAQSSNALLKFLEEPTKKTILFLLTDSYMNLIETIRSRAININLKSLESSVIEKILKDKYPKVDSQNLAMVIGYSNGLMGYAEKLLQDEAEFDIIKEQVKNILKNLIAPSYTQKEYIDSISKEDFESWLSVFKIVASDLLSSASGNSNLVRCIFAKEELESVVKKLTLEKIEVIYKKLSEYSEQSVFNLSPTLFIESLFYIL